MERKRFLALFLFAVMLISVVGQRPEPASATTASTAVNGSISASIISVSVPTSLAFAVDPNDVSATYCSDALIQNNTNAPITVSIGGGGDSFKQATDSTWKPVDYLPSDLDWDDLGKNASENALALGVIIKSSSEWRRLVRTTTLWVKELSAISGNVVIGDLDPHTSAYMTFQIYHGYSFSEIKTCKYNIVWSFSLAES